MAQTAEVPIQIAGRYSVVRELGAGGMGTVYEAIDETLGRRVALKLLHAGADVSHNAVERLEREARAAARLGHPNIVRVLDVGRLPDGAFLAMEQLAGETLDQRLRRERTLSPNHAIRIHLQLLDALAAAHDEGVLHRDVKPSNIFLTTLADGSELVKLLDFGIAYLLEEQGSKKLTATGIALGTPAYMAPERVCGEGLDPRADLYSVGVCLFECLSSQLPFLADTPMGLRGQILLEAAPSLRELRPDISASIARVVAQVLAKEANERFDSARQMAEALRACLSTPAGATGLGTITQIGAFVDRRDRAERETKPQPAMSVELALPPAAPVPALGKSTLTFGSFAAETLTPAAD